MESNWPRRWGFIGDLRKCIGKTIEKAELLGMPFGCTSDTCFLVQFTDGSRAFFIGRPSDCLAVGPRADEMEKSLIIKPEEYGEVQAQKLRDNQRRQIEYRRSKEQQLERLKKELYGDDGDGRE